MSFFKNRNIACKALYCHLNGNNKRVTITRESARKSRITIDTKIQLRVMNYCGNPIV